jgi:hypothetical protein
MIGALLVLAACHGPFRDGFGGTDFGSVSQPGIRDTFVDSGVQTSAVVVDYAFTDGIGCVGAGVTVLDVTIAVDQAGDFTVAYPCDDGELRIGELSGRSADVLVRGVAVGGTAWSARATVGLDGGVDTRVSLALVQES